MRKALACLVPGLLLVLLQAGQPFAASLPALEKALESWQGAREVQLAADGQDPLASPELLPLVEIFLRHGFAVSTSPETAGKAGLRAEIRRQPAPLIVLKRAADDAIIAMERLPAATAGSRRATAPPPPSAPQPSAAPAKRPVTPVAATKTRHLRRHAPLPLEGKPTALVWLDEKNGDLALLAEEGIRLYRLRDRQLQRRSLVVPPKKALRPLALSRGDIDGDGAPELAAVWAEDIHSIYDGTNSQIWSQLFRFHDGRLTPLSLQRGYIRLLPALGVIQHRGPYRPFAGPVRKLQLQQERATAGPPLPWGRRNIFALTPWTGNSGLAWTKAGTLTLLDRMSGEPLPGGTLLENFGNFQVAEVAVQLKDPEFRSGFEKEDKVLETYVSLPPRLVHHADDAMYTIHRGRSSGTFLIGRPGGEDRIARISLDDGDLVLDYPFPPVEAFIIDFALGADSDGSDVLLLLNDKENAGGRPYLLLQHASGPKD